MTSLEKWRAKPFIPLECIILKKNLDPWPRPIWEERLEQIVSGAALVADRGNARGIVEAGNNARQALQAGLKLNIQKKNVRSEPKFLFCP